MAVTIKAPQFSFVQFAESDDIEACEFGPEQMCLPVYQDNDVSFQFILVFDTQGEADFLCGLTNDAVTIGIAENCQDGLLIEFTEKPQRFRISPTQVLFNWTFGVPNFASVISAQQCFRIRILIQNIYDTADFCSNCFQRITDPCHTSVLDYSNDDNAFGFDYCGGVAVDDENDPCEPTFIEFTDVPNISIPYTLAMQTKYGNVPTVQVWIYDTSGELVDMGIRASLDAFPPTVIKADFGGNASGIIKIS